MCFRMLVRPKVLISTLSLMACISLADKTQAGEEGNTGWRGHKAALSFTYDDALNVHIDRVAPALEKHGFSATFYLNGSAPAFQARMLDWRALAKKGHELGNHTIYHPCDGSKPNRKWVDTERDLSTWSVTRYMRDVMFMSAILKHLDGQNIRSFAYSCGDTKAGGASLEPEIGEMFVAARHVSGQLNKIDQIDYTHLNAHSVSAEDFESLKRLVDRAVRERAWLVLLFHGVGGEHRLNVEAKVHQALLDYVASRKSDIWVAPVRTIAGFTKTSVEKTNSKNFLLKQSK